MLLLCATTSKPLMVLSATHQHKSSKPIVWHLAAVHGLFVMLYLTCKAFISLHEPNTYRAVLWGIEKWPINQSAQTKEAQSTRKVTCTKPPWGAVQHHIHFQKSSSCDNVQNFGKQHCNIKQKGERRKFSKGIYAQEYVEEKCAPAARSRWNIELTLLTGIYSSVATDVFRGSFRVRGTGSRGEFALPWKNLIAWVNPTTLVHSLEAAEWKKNCSGVQFMFCLLLLVTWKSCW